MKGRAGGWLMVLGGLGIGLVLWLAPAVGASGGDAEATAARDFAGLVRAVTDRYGVHATHIPMMWLASFAARSVTHGGVTGMKVEVFEDAEKIATVDGDGTEFGDLVRERLGGRWSATVRQHEAGGEDTYIYTQDDPEEKNGGRTRLIVVNLDHKELNMVAMSLNAEQLAKWIREQQQEQQQKQQQDQQSKHKDAAGRQTEAGD